MWSGRWHSQNAVHTTEKLLSVYKTIQSLNSKGYNMNLQHNPPLRDMTPCSLVDCYQCFRGTYYLNVTPVSPDIFLLPTSSLRANVSPTQSAHGKQLFKGPIFFILFSPTGSLRANISPIQSAQGKQPFKGPIFFILFSLVIRVTVPVSPFPISTALSSCLAYHSKPNMEASPSKTSVMIY